MRQVLKEFLKISDDVTKQTNSFYKKLTFPFSYNPTKFVKGISEQHIAERRVGYLHDNGSTFSKVVSCGRQHDACLGCLGKKGYVNICKIEEFKNI